jgi:hypothetical protein
MLKVGWGVEPPHSPRCSPWGAHTCTLSSPSEDEDQTRSQVASAKLPYGRVQAGSPNHMNVSPWSCASAPKKVNFPEWPPPAPVGAGSVWGTWGLPPPALLHVIPALLHTIARTPAFVHQQAAQQRHNSPRKGKKEKRDVPFAGFQKVARPPKEACSAIKSS